MKKAYLLLLIILIIAAFLRFYQLNSIPTGLHGDAASQGYNAYSLLKTGTDRYGQSFPLLFRSLGSYQPPIYTYLTIIPVSIFGNSQFSTHFISALSGTLLVLVTYFFALTFKPIKNKTVFALIAASLIAVSPWSIMFSRMAVEANLAVLLFALSMLLFVYSLERFRIFPWACLLLGITTHAYYSERVIALLFIPVFIFLFRKDLLKHKFLVAVGVLLFGITQIPHWILFQTGAFSRRFDQVSYFSSEDIKESNPFFQIKIIGQNFLHNYLSYFSLSNLFAELNPALGRLLPGLGAFYGWLVIPLFIGIRDLAKGFSSPYIKMLLLLAIITPIPAGLTGDSFYPLRTLDFLWVITLIVSLGLYTTYHFFQSKLLKTILFGILILYSLFSLFISYFIISKYESKNSFGYSYMKLMDKLPEYQDKTIVIDTGRDYGTGVRVAYLKKYDPLKLQQQLKSQLLSPYYNRVVNTDETYTMDNIIVRKLDWADPCTQNLIIVGDQLLVSPEQVKEHNLNLEFTIPDPAGNKALYGYSTHPKASCK